MPSTSRKEELARQSLIAEFASFEIPKAFQTLFQTLRFSPQEKALAQAVMQIECTARPPEVRALEFAVAFLSLLKTFITFSNPANYTVGKFQIGVVTSLAWTRTPLRRRDYLKRLIFLGTNEGATRLFRIAIRRSRVKGTSRNELEKFAEFYNGRQISQPLSLSYAEILQILVKRHQRAFCLKQSLPRNISTEVDERIEARLDRIRKLLKSGQDLDAAVMLCSNSSQQILHKKYYGENRKIFPVLDTPRSVGSAIKVALYSAFIEEKSATPDLPLKDEPICVRWQGQEFFPRNSDGKFRGTVSLEYAFANSINIPALHALEALGVENFVYYLRKCGIYNPLPNTPLLGLGPISMTGIELLATLTPILTGGCLAWPLSFDKNSDNPPITNGECILSAQTCQIMRHLLLSTVSSGTARFLESYCGPGLGGKTGTSEGARDLWFLGAVNEDIYGLVWLGYRDGRKIETRDEKEASASRFAVPVWGEVLAVLLRHTQELPIQERNYAANNKENKCSD